MEQLVIFILFVVVSIISSIIQSRKKAQEEARQRGEFPPSVPRPERPVTHWPRNVGQWQEQLKRMLEENAPPVIRPVIVPEKREAPSMPPPKPAKAAAAQPHFPGIPAITDESEGPSIASVSAHEHVSNMYDRVKQRLRAAGRHQTTHRPRAVRQRAPVPTLRRLTRNPAALRDAFVASLIFSPPKALELPEER